MQKHKKVIFFSDIDKDNIQEIVEQDAGNNEEEGKKKDNQLKQKKKEHKNGDGKVGEKKQTARTIKTRIRKGRRKYEVNKQSTILWVLEGSIPWIELNFDPG